ncbi:MAG TPA: hypothetical protein P5318_05515 [Candidatus Hydrogenedentes bacterium]|nr:hypothetical protein [Candidatus Hydrogenedentota bacterium]HPC15178.1 hypothetical protein [Candidatus Hydrogenedentota bacterium]HRT19567.1 hypothetical protein [Candidatus Hydrogenedentota bacterium]HRT64177.1 hypothetical protein [Candidatus Hydrogenedentota bacterium]
MTGICAAMILVLAHDIAAQSPGRELFADTTFERGFLLTAASHPAPKVELGVLRTTARASALPPTWRMAQWASRYLLEPGACRDIGKNRWLAETPGKRVVIIRTKPERTCVRLEVFGKTEYAGRMRAYGEPWPHLLIEQRFDKPIPPAPLKRLAFAVEMRIPYCKPLSEATLNPSLHTAHVTAFWTVHNMKPGNPDFQDMIWFGLPLFDARQEIPGPHYALDTGKADASHKFICTLDGRRFWDGPTGDGRWRSIETDLRQLLREGLAISQEHGHLKNTQFEDLAITTFNLGWEIPGPYDAAIEFRGLSLKAFD